MWNEPREDELVRLPKLYDTDGVLLEDKLIHMHFFIGGCDWYVSEYSPEERLFFGYAILHDDFQNAEWGYMSFDEMRAINIKGIEIDRDLHWKPTRAINIERINRRD